DLVRGDIGVVERGAVLERDDHERAERLRAGQAEQLAEKLRRFLLVARRDNGVVETDGHTSCLSLRECACCARSRELQRYLGAVSSNAMLSGSRNSKMYDGPMSLTGSCPMPSSSRCAAAASNSALLAVRNAMWSRPQRSSWKRSVATGRNPSSVPPRS